MVTNWINSVAPGEFEWNFKQVIFKLMLMIDDYTVSCEIALKWMPLDPTDEKSTLVQVMAWCRQAPSDYLSQCWPRSCHQMVSLDRNELKKCIFPLNLNFITHHQHPCPGNTTLHTTQCNHWSQLEPSSSRSMMSTMSWWILRDQGFQELKMKLSH